jgi:hypothetical protein
VHAALIVYAVGVVIGLLFTDARPVARVGLAVLWPLGPLAFVATIAILVAASAIAFPVLGAAAATAIGLWWMMS